MSYFFSASKLLFVTDDLKADYLADGTWPTDAVAVTDATWAQYISTPQSGDQLGSDGSGNPAWVAIPITLARAQQTKIAAINAQYESHQTASFSSSALGATHTYPSDSVAQTQLGGRITEVHIHLMALVWAAAATKAAGNWCSPGNGWLYQCTIGGLTATLSPTWPTALGASVVDGSVTWIAYRQWNGQFLCTDSLGNTASQSHTPDQIWQVGLDAVANIDTLMAHRMNLIGQVNAATTVSAVNAIPNW